MNQLSSNPSYPSPVMRTPPTTSGVLDTSSLSRRGSERSSLHLDSQSEWNPDILVEKASPQLLKKLNGGSTLSVSRISI
ncbi:hypothetical protein VKT23_016577 [Stygiomarasmius scandens]|uniref:Uncharacterized protein n=1 Tax=Marasmiellus scandens TaxID=2682957 RepID=A0ABR1IYW9_9AGAR